MRRGWLNSRIEMFSVDAWNAAQSSRLVAGATVNCPPSRYSVVIVCMKLILDICYRTCDSLLVALVVQSHNCQMIDVISLLLYWIMQPSIAYLYAKGQLNPRCSLQTSHQSVTLGLHSLCGLRDVLFVCSVCWLFLFGCQYKPVQVIDWKDSSPKWPIMCWWGH